MSWFCNTLEAKEQIEICKKNNCPDCEKCIWIQESSNAMSKYGTFIEQELKTEKIIKTKHIPTKFDNLAKDIVNNDYPDCDHPLLPEILKVFKK